MIKICSRCGKELPEEMFQVHDLTHRYKACRICIAEARAVVKPTYSEDERRVTLNTCIHCGEEKPLVNFSKQSSNHNGHRNYCKECDSVIRKEKRIATRKQVQSYKSHKGCAKCNESKFYMLDFHHTDPATKESDVSKLMDSGVKGKLWEEVAKCTILCRNHHQEFHYLETKEDLTLEKYLK